jgi:hypothetical protein
MLRLSPRPISIFSTSRPSIATTPTRLEKLLMNAKRCSNLRDSLMDTPSGT